VIVWPRLVPAAAARAKAGAALAGPLKDTAAIGVYPPEPADPAAVAVDFNHVGTRLLNEQEPVAGLSFR
jgi:hypothetical protein